MFLKLAPELTAKEKTTVRAAAAEHARLVGLAERYQRHHMMQGVNLPPHPLHLEVDEALRAAAASPSLESCDAVLLAVAKKTALSDGIAEALGSAVHGAIDRLRLSLRPICDRLTAAARERFDAEAEQRRAALPSGDAPGVILEDPSASLEAAIADARTTLESEIADFMADPLVSLPALAV